MKYLVAYVIGLEGQIGHSWEIGRREIERDTPIIGIDDLDKIEQDIEAHKFQAEEAHDFNRGRNRPPPAVLKHYSRLEK